MNLIKFSLFHNIDVYVKQETTLTFVTLTCEEVVVVSFFVGVEVDIFFSFFKTTLYLYIFGIKTKIK